MNDNDIFVSGFYDNVIHCVNQPERKAKVSSGSQMIVTDAVSPCRSYSSEFQKWLSTSRNSIDPNSSIVNETDEHPRLQSESTRSVIDVDSDDDVPWDLSMSSQNSHSINDREHCKKKVFCTECGCPGSSASFVASQHPKMNENNTFLLGFQRRFLDFTILAGHNNDSCDWRISSSQVNQSLGASSPLQDVVTNLIRFDKRWTLKYREPSPGLIELWPNTGAYITELELHYCLKRSKKCTQLARLLTVHVFSETALKKCRYVNNVRGNQNLQLDKSATIAIVNFVLRYGCTQHWRPSSDRSIKNAIRYQLIMSKKKSDQHHVLTL